VEFPESIPNFFQNCREVGFLMEGEDGDIPVSVKDSTNNFDFNIFISFVEPHLLNLILLMLFILQDMYV
jgi:nickel-dependent lactate racemase